MSRRLPKMMWCPTSNGPPRDTSVDRLLDSSVHRKIFAIDGWIRFGIENEGAANQNKQATHHILFSLSSLFIGFYLILLLLASSSETKVGTLVAVNIK